MKITKRVSVGFSEDDYFIMKGRAKEARLTMSAYIRSRLFTIQYAQQPLPALNRPPQPPVKMDITRGNMVHVIIELKQKLSERRKIVDSYEEDLANEVGIK